MKIPELRSLPEEDLKEAWKFIQREVSGRNLNLECGLKRTNIMANLAIL